MITIQPASNLDSIRYQSADQRLYDIMLNLSTFVKSLTAIERDVHSIVQLVHLCRTIANTTQIRTSNLCGFHKRGFEYLDIGEPVAVIRLNILYMHISPYVTQSIFIAHFNSLPNALNDVSPQTRRPGAPGSLASPPCAGAVPPSQRPAAADCAQTPPSSGAQFRPACRRHSRCKWSSRWPSTVPRSCWRAARRPAPEPLSCARSARRRRRSGTGRWCRPRWRGACCSPRWCTFRFWPGRWACRTWGCLREVVQKKYFFIV